jgi:Domain of unknown function (DUF4349)
MRWSVAGLVLAAMLIGCGQADKSESGSTTTASEGYAIADQDMASRGITVEEAAPAAAPAPAPPPPMDAMGGEQRAQGGVPAQPNPSQPAGPSPVLFLAYAYQTTLELPADRLAGVMDEHVRACQQAGARLCQLMGSTRNGDPESQMSGYVQMRAEPVWLRTFMGGIAAQVEAADGKVRSQTTSTEDLTRQIVDTEARLRAGRALRDRLQRLLESRPGRLSDLLDVERELARVQGEIDATESNLAVMRTRVSMSELTLSYESSARPLRSDTFQPLGDALANFLGLVVMSFAAIVTIIGATLPFALVIGLIGWGVVAWRRRNGGRIWRRKPPPEPPTPA